MGDGLREWRRQVAEWREKYGVKKTSTLTHPNLLKTKAARPCEKCKNHRKRMHRHHIENDFLFAQMHPDLYAARYVEFRREDIVWLCSRCHGKLHELPDWQILHWEVIEEWENGKIIHGEDFTLPPKTCDEYRGKFRSICNDFLRSNRTKRGASGAKKGSSRGRKR